MAGGAFGPRDIGLWSHPGEWITGFIYFFLTPFFN
jgi:hypothetical protein